MKAFSQETSYKPTDLEVGDLIVWHIPQIPMASFYIKVDSWDQAIEMQNLLAYYDQFQYYHGVKPDYANASGVMIWGGQQYIDESRENVDPSEWSDSDGLCDVESEFDYQEQLVYLGVLSQIPESVFGD